MVLPFVDGARVTSRRAYRESLRDRRDANLFEPRREKGTAGDRFVESDPGFPADLPGADLLRGVQRMLPAGEDQIVDVEQFLVDQLRISLAPLGQPAQHGVQAAGREHGQGELVHAVHEFDPYPGKAPLDRRDGVRHGHVAPGGPGGDAQFSSPAAQEIADLAGGIGAGHIDDARVMQQRVAEGCEPHAGRRPLEQRHAQVILEVLDAPRQRGLADMQPVGRGADPAGIGHGQEIAQQVGAPQQAAA
ncbi:MAG: hypothetical protein ABT00_16125 [Bordetella sp. SCN 68-11]|nr:MAG: hypothetical protein ABT00_16125 [Bordetella sp. SCN 68-11]